MESSRQIEEAAAAWLLKRDSGSWSDDDPPRLRAWLEAATANRVAFLRLEAAWDEMNRLKALGAGLPSRTVPTSAQLADLPRTYDEGHREIQTTNVPINAPTDGSTKKPARGTLIALAAAIGLFSIALYLYAAAPFSGDRYSTPVGGVASVPLKDGSNITLNTSSRIRVRLTEKERRIDLAQGEAFFEVARDPARPFVVHAGNKRVIAVGTKFSVRHDGDDVRVVVTEGVVRFEDTKAQARVALLRATQPEASGASSLTAGAVARAAGNETTVRTTSVPQVEELLSWRSGYVVFHETALADAVAEFNRYTERKIVIRDPQLASMRLTGKFRSSNFEVFVRLLEESFPIHAQRLPDEIVLTGTQGAAAP